jgi:hypothetical protein
MDLTLNFEEKGRLIYKDNEHYRRLANFMEHPEFREFYDNYMKDWSSVQMIILFMKTYEAIEKHSDTELSPYEKIAVLKNLIENSETRQKLCKGALNWSNMNTLKSEISLPLILDEKESVVRTSS